MMIDGADEGDLVTFEDFLEAELDGLDGYSRVFTGDRQLARFNRTPDGTEQFGSMPRIGNGVRMWITWRLSDGSYIHVFAIGDDRPAGDVWSDPSRPRARVSVGKRAPGQP